MRIAHNCKEEPWKDIAGYAILALSEKEKRNNE